MKIEISSSGTIVYLYRYSFDLDDISRLNQEIKAVFVRLIKTYHIDFFGYSLVHLYNNKNYGTILEIEKNYNDDFNLGIIDLKLDIHDNQTFYLEFDDYLFDELVDKMFVLNNKYYINITDVDSIVPYLEYGRLIYKREMN